MNNSRKCVFCDYKVYYRVSIKTHKIFLINSDGSYHRNKGSCIITDDMRKRRALVEDAVNSLKDAREFRKKEKVIKSKKIEIPAGTEFQIIEDDILKPKFLD